MNFEFVWWPLFALLPLPLAARAWLPPAHGGRFISLRMFATPWLSQFGKPYSPPKKAYQKVVAWIIWSLLIIAAARPEFVGDPIRLDVKSRQLLLAVDLSDSMLQEDMIIGNHWVTRLDAAKAVISEFIDARRGDRIGLILFGSLPYLQTPYTDDHVTLKKLLMESEAGMAGPQTAIGDAIGLAAKHAGKAEDRKVLILLTDGKNTAGGLAPIEGARLARDVNMVIYTIGLGASVAAGTQGMTAFDLFTRQVTAGSQIDENALQQIAYATNGQYLRANNTEQLLQIYNYLNELEPTGDKPKFYRPRSAYYHWPLALAVALLALTLFFSVMQTRIPNFTITAPMPIRMPAPPQPPAPQPAPAPRKPIILSKKGSPNKAPRNAGGTR